MRMSARGGFEHRQPSCLAVALGSAKAALTRDFASLKTGVITSCSVPCQRVR